MGQTQSGSMGDDTAAADALAALRTPDPRSLFWIVGGAMGPEDAAVYQQRVMAQFDVPTSVPETVTKSFALHDILTGCVRSTSRCCCATTCTPSRVTRPGSSPGLGMAAVRYASVGAGFGVRAVDRPCRSRP
jgi:hypothetical protein